MLVDCLFEPVSGIGSGLHCAIISLVFSSYNAPNFLKFATMVINYFMVKVAKFEGNRMNLFVGRCALQYILGWPKLKPSANTSFFNDCLRGSRMVLSYYNMGRIEGRMRSMSHAEISPETGILRRTVSNFISLLKIHHIPNAFYSLDDHE